MPTDDFKTISIYKGYISKPEITNINPSFLVKESQNVLVDFANRIVSRLGYTLYGAANTGAGKIVSSYEWVTSSGKEFPLRTYDGRLEFYWNATWNLLKSGMATSDLAFAKVLDYTEQIDVMMWVMNDAFIYKWSGGVAKVASSTSTTLTKQGVLASKTTIAFVAGTPYTVAPTITDSASGFVTAGFAAGDTLFVSGSTANSRNFTIATVTAGTITLVMKDILTTEAASPAITVHNGEPTWKSSRFLTAGTRKIIHAGIEYVYTGGETTATLTGLTSFPAITIGDPVWQTSIAITLPAGITNNFANFTPNLIAVQLNQLILASTKSMMVFGSENDDYIDFTLTTPRAPGDPWQKPINDFATCIVPIDNPSQSVNSLMVGSGKNSFYHIFYQLSNDNTNELVNLVRLKTAAGSGLISAGAFTSVKNATAYISREPALDTLSSVDSPDRQNVPLSDLIKNDFDDYNFTGSHLKYWKRAIYIALPSEGLVLIYDLMRNLWQPPQTIPVGRLAIIGDELYGHSSVNNESYKLFDGYNDNGNFIPQVARFAYNNGGRRDLLKTMSAAWTDGYISQGGTLEINLHFGFNGTDGIKNFTLLGGDSKVINTPVGSPMGSEPMGVLDGLPLADTGLEGMNRFWQIDTMPLVNFTEMFMEYRMSDLSQRFALVAYGNNMEMGSTSAVSHKK